MMRKRFLMLVIASQIILSACVPLMFAGAGAAGGAYVVSDNRTVQRVSQDSDLAYQANLRLQGDQELADKAHVSASAYDGVLLLVGETPTPELRAKAQELVADLPHIRHLYNEITIGQPIGVAAASDDAMMTTNIKARIVGMSDVSSSHFSVVTENKVVYLMGLSTRSEADIVAHMISRRPGVKKVVKLVEYIPSG